MATRCVQTSAVSKSGVKRIHILRTNWDFPQLNPDSGHQFDWHVKEEPHPFPHVALTR